MFVEECRRAITASPRTGLDALAKQVWAAFGADAVTEIEASELCELIAARRAVPSPQARPPRRVGSRPRSSASLERRRAWTASGWMPPAIAARFTMGEAAALGVVIREVATAGRCALPVGAIAARAGVCATTVRNALREARKLGFISVEVRRVAYDRNLPNVITISSRELALWVKTRARAEGQGGGCRTASPTPNHIHSSSETTFSTEPKAGSRGRGGLEPHRPRSSPRWPEKAVDAHQSNRRWMGSQGIRHCHHEAPTRPTDTM